MLHQEGAANRGELMAVVNRLRRCFSSRPPAAFLPRRATYWTDFIRAHVEGSDPHSDYYDKFRQRTLIEEAGYPTPRLLASVERATAELLESLPSAFVLKVPHKSTTRGVIPVWRDGSGFVNGFTGSTLTAGQLSDEINSHLHEDDPQLLVEEFFEGEDGPRAIPQDYMIYSFESGVEFVLRINRNMDPHGYVLINPNGGQLSDSQVVLPHKKTAPIPPSMPTNAPQMLEAARALRHYCDRPSMSVDMYSNGRHFVIGELTTTPGAIYYGTTIQLAESEDLRLGGIVGRSYHNRGWTLPTITENPPSVARRHRMRTSSRGVR